MKPSVIGLLLIILPLQVMACPPSAPLLDDVPEAKRRGDYETDRAHANEARAKLWARCYEKVDHPCIVKCDAKMLSLYGYQEDEVHYLYSHAARKQARETVQKLLKKWNAMPSKGDASVGIVLQ